MNQLSTMNRKKYLAKNTVLFALNSIGIKLIIFFLVPVYTAALNTSEYGTADLVTTLSSIVVPIITLNIHEAILRFYLDKNSEHYKLLSISVSVIVFSAIFGLVIIPISNIWPLLKPFAIYFYFYCVTQGIYNICIAVLRGKELLLPFAICNIIVTFVGALLNVFFLIYLKVGVTGYFLGFIISYVIGILFSTIYVRIYKLIGHFHIDKALLKRMCSFSVLLIPNSLMWWIMNASDRLMVISMIGAAANGIYAISYKIPSAISTASTVFNQAWSYSAVHEENSTDNNHFNEKMYNYLFDFQLIVTATLLFAIKPIMKIYVAENYFTAWQYVPPLLIGYFFMSLGTFFSAQYTVKKDSKGFLISGTIGAVVNIVLNFLLIPFLGSLGAALATATAYISVFAYRVYDTKKYFQIKWFTSNKLFAVSVLVLMSLINYMNYSFLWIILLLLYFFAIFFARHTLSYLCTSIWVRINKRKNKQ